MGLSVKDLRGKEEDFALHLLFVSVGFADEDHFVFLAHINLFYRLPFKNWMKIK